MVYSTLFVRGKQPGISNSVIPSKPSPPPLLLVLENCRQGHNQGQIYISYTDFFEMHTRVNLTIIQVTTRGPEILISPTFLYTISSAPSLVFKTFLPHSPKVLKLLRIIFHASQIHINRLVP